MINNKSELKVPKILGKKEFVIFVNFCGNVSELRFQDCRKDDLELNIRAECDNELEEFLTRGENRFTHLPRAFNALNLQL